jgi:hypothetical protein
MEKRKLFKYYGFGFFILAGGILLISQYKNLEMSAYEENSSGEIINTATLTYNDSLGQPRTIQSYPIKLTKTTSEVAPVFPTGSTLVIHMPHGNEAVYVVTWPAAIGTVTRYYVNATYEGWENPDEDFPSTARYAEFCDNGQCIIGNPYTVTVTAYNGSMASLPLTLFGTAPTYPDDWTPSSFPDESASSSTATETITAVNSNTSSSNSDNTNTNTSASTETAATGNTVFGILKESATPNSPITDSKIVVKDFSGKKIAETTTDQNGAYTIKTDLSTGQYKMEISKPGYATVKKDVSLNQNVSADLQLKKQSKIVTWFKNLWQKITGVK